MRLSCDSLLHQASDGLNSLGYQNYFKHHDLHFFFNFLLFKTDERRTASGNAGPRTTPSGSNSAGNTSTVSSNGSKHSKFQHPNREQNTSSHWDPDSDGNWLCSHYKRHCYVKFDCCDKFWPCHRCHNNQSTCGRKKLKSRDTRMLKCVYCNKVQQVPHIFCR